MKKYLFSLIFCICLISAAAASAVYASQSDLNTEEPEYINDFENAVYIMTGQDGIRAFRADKDSSDFRLQPLAEKELSGNGILIYDKILELGEGTFVLSGEFEGQVLVDAGKKHDTVLVLNGFHIVNEEDAALLCKKTNLLTIVLADGSQNSIVSGNEIEINEQCRELTEDASGGALQSKADTLITGSGSLDVYGYINNGIHVTKSLTINAGENIPAETEEISYNGEQKETKEQANINITAANNGIKIKDTFISESGFIIIRSGGDGVKAEEEAAEDQEGTGVIIINGGTLEIDSFDDGMQALLDLQVNNGSVSVNAYGTYNTKGAYRKTRDETFSAKGLKSDGTLTINGGSTVINSYSDGLHSEGRLDILSGSVSIYCGDDGIHSDEMIYIGDGTIDISNSYEGIEANQIQIDGGTITLFAWDDGMNANGGSGSFGGPGGPPGGPPGSRGNQSDAPTEMPNLIINGGEIYVNSSGDGLDSNGNIAVNGGRTVVDGPTGNWNGPLDSGRENGGSIIISDGLVFAGGASGMAETFERSSSQCSFQAILSSNYTEDCLICILDEEGNELLSHRPASGGNSIVFSCPELKAEKTYILQIDDDPYEIKLTGISTKVNLKRSQIIK